MRIHWDNSRRSPHPRQVPGYEEARRAGRLPTVPEQPPALTVRPTARAQGHRLIAFAFGGLLVVILLAKLLERLDLPEFLGFALFMAISPGFLLLLFLRWLPAVGRQSVAELQRGYTTIEATFGALWLTASAGRRPPWDYRGTWLLDHRDGRVLREPDRGIDPPGMYPSPRRPGRMELWSGAAWLAHYAD